MLSPGQVVDRYTVDALLGQGGMAVVYRVVHNQLGSFHALKLLTVSSPSIRERLLQEGRVQASLRHPNIVAVTDVLDVDGAPGLVMEYVEGASLDGWLDKTRPSLDEAERLFRQIVAGVQHAHALGLVHRDLKPANVLMQHVSGTHIPKVADFGLAKALAEDAGGMKATRSGIAMGTPAYMAPEQIRDAKNVDARADVFSLGCILYELVCGRQAFEGPDVLSIFNAVASGSFPPPVSLVPDLPVRVQRAIQGALKTDRERRVPDCATLIRLLDDAPVELPPTPALGNTWTGEEPVALDAGGGTVPATPRLGVEPRVGTFAPDDAGRAPQSQIDGTLSPKSLGGSMEGARSKKGIVGAVLGVGALGVVGAVVALGLVAVAGGAWWVDRSATRRLEGFLAARTGGEVSFEDVAVRPGGLIVTGLTVRGSDGKPVATVKSAWLKGDLSGRRWKLGRVELDGLSIDLRHDGKGWVLPSTTAATFRGEGGAAPWQAAVGVLSTGPVEVAVHTRAGDLTASAGSAELTDLSLALDGGFGWVVKGARLGELAVRGTEDVLRARGLSADATGATFDELDLWVRLRTDGLLDLPPVVSGHVADWGGGELRDPVKEPWQGVDLSWLPLAPAQVRASSGTVHVLDRANAVKAVQWDVRLDHLTLGPAAGDRLPISVGGAVGAGTVGLDGDLSKDGLFKGRLAARNLPMAELAPYLERGLREKGVELAGGTLEGTLALSLRAHSYAGALDAAIDAPSLLERPGGKAQAKWLEPRAKVSARAQFAGNLSDPAFQPVDLVMAELVEALAPPPAGLFRPKKVARVEPEPEAPAPPAAVDAPVADAPPDAPVPVEEASKKPTPRSTIERWNRDVQKALEEVEIQVTLPGSR